MALEIRSAKREDTADILELIKGLAVYEKMENEVTADPKTLEQQLFDEGNAHVALAFQNNTLAGFALYFFNFSTFKGKKGLYLEDLFVRPEYRGKGIGNALFDHLTQLAKEQKCGRMEWVCLDWNEPAIAFYKKKHAVPMDGWIVFRLDERHF